MESIDASARSRECETMLEPLFLELQDSATVGGWSPDKAAFALLCLAIKNLKHHVGDINAAVARAAKAVEAEATG